MTTFIVKEVGGPCFCAMVYGEDGEFRWASPMVTTKKKAEDLLKEKLGILKHISATNVKEAIR